MIGTENLTGKLDQVRQGPGTIHWALIYSVAETVQGQDKDKV